MASPAEPTVCCNLKHFTSCLTNCKTDKAWLNHYFIKFLNGYWHSFWIFAVLVVIIQFSTQVNTFLWCQFEL